MQAGQAAQVACRAFLPCQEIDPTAARAACIPASSAKAAGRSGVSTRVFPNFKKSLIAGSASPTAYGGEQASAESILPQHLHSPGDSLPQQSRSTTSLPPDRSLTLNVDCYAVRMSEP